MIGCIFGGSPGLVVTKLFRLLESPETTYSVHTLVYCLKFQVWTSVPIFLNPFTGISLQMM